MSSTPVQMYNAMLQSLCCVSSRSCTLQICGSSVPVHGIPSLQPFSVSIDYHPSCTKASFGHEQGMSNWRVVNFSTFIQMQFRMQMETYSQTPTKSLLPLPSCFSWQDLPDSLNLPSCCLAFLLLPFCSLCNSAHSATLQHSLLADLHPPPSKNWIKSFVNGMKSFVCPHAESNYGPQVYKTCALPTEL